MFVRCIEAIFCYMGYGNEKNRYVHMCCGQWNVQIGFAVKNIYYICYIYINEQYPLIITLQY